MQLGRITLWTTIPPNPSTSMAMDHSGWVKPRTAVFWGKGRLTFPNCLVKHRFATVSPAFEALHHKYSVLLSASVKWCPSPANSRQQFAIIVYLKDVLFPLPPLLPVNVISLAFPSVCSQHQLIATHMVCLAAGRADVLPLESVPYSELRTSSGLCAGFFLISPVVTDLLTWPSWWLICAAFQVHHVPPSFLKATHWPRNTMFRFI